HDDVAVLVLRPVLEGDDAPLRTRPRLALVHHLGLRIDRIAVEDGLRELDLLEAEVAHRGPEGRLADREPHRDPERQDAVDQRLAELRLRRGVEVEVERLRVHRQAGEENVVGLGDRPPWLVAERLPDLETEEEGMAGKFFEELEVGQTFRHQPGRTITEADNVFFTCLTMNPQPLHLDFHAASKAEFGKPLVNSLLTLGIAVGLSVGETTLGTTVGNLGFEKVEFPKPVFHGDTIYAETEVVDKRESRSRPQWGIVTFEHRAKNQHGDVVMLARRNAMMRKRGT